MNTMAQSNPVDSIPQPPLRMLVVDDNPSCIRLMQRFLSQYSDCTTVTGDPVHAMKLAKESKFDIIWMDLKLPGLSGIQLTNLIREQDKKREKPYICALTAFAFLLDKKACLKAGLDDFVSKPFYREDLEGVISRYLDSR